MSALDVPGLFWLPCEFREDVVLALETRGRHLIAHAPRPSEVGSEDSRRHATVVGHGNKLLRLAAEIRREGAL